MILKESVNQMAVWPQIWYAIGLAEMVYSFEGLQMVVTRLDGLSAEFGIKTIHDEIAASITKRLRELAGPMGFRFAEEANVIRCTYNPRPGEEWQKRTDADV